MAREYDKLVRDDIPAVIWESGETPVIHTVSGPEYERRLLDKLEEETAELRDDPSIEELADVLAVVLAIREHWEVGADRLAATRERKAERRGGFERGVVLDRVE